MRPSREQHPSPPPERRQELQEALRRRLADRPEVLESYLFGSAARGEAAEHSDVDVAVFVDRALIPDDSGFGYAARLAAELEQVSRGRTVEVVVLNDTTPLLYHRVLRDGVRLTSRELTATTTREGRALSRYFDDLPRIRLLDEALRRRILSGSFGR